jgi:tRNA-(ms[2]io[6]A)-hydroxylase
VILARPTSATWVTAACADLETRRPRVLLDHAHCEKKAAAMALRHVDRHADWPGLARRMSRLAREELVHFERVLAELRARRVPFRGLPGAGYGAALLAAARRPTEPPARAPRSTLGERTIDEMLVCALIEARSHERFERLAAALAGTPLGGLYADLCAAEARHGAIYLDLAGEAAGGASVAARLAELAAHEADVVERPGLPLRMHSGGA